MITVEHLKKSYGDIRAVDDISFSIGEGEIVGFLGLNGAGKSTTMNLLAGYQAADAGRIWIDGLELQERPKEARRRIGYLPEIPPLYMDMTVREYLGFIWELKKAKQPRERHLDEICARTGLSFVYRRLIGNLSKGYRQRVGIAYAMVGAPPILILDEPTAGLDPVQIMEIRGLIKELGKDHTVMLSTHILPEAQTVCRRMIVMNRGRIVADGSAQELVQEGRRNDALTVSLAGPPREMLAALRRMEKVAEARLLRQPEEGVYEFALRGSGGSDLRRRLFALAAARGWPVMSMGNAGRTLEEAFVRLTGAEMYETAGRRDRRGSSEKREASGIRNAREKKKDGETNVEREKNGSGGGGSVEG